MPFRIVQHLLECFEKDSHCVKSVHIGSFSGPYFPAFELNTDQKNSEYGHFSCSVNQLKTFEGNALKINKKLYLLNRLQCKKYSLR